MPRVPYTAAEFIALMEHYASLHDDYTQGLADLKEASETLNKDLAVFLETGAIFPKVVNDGGIVPTGSYATAVYYNLDFGVKISYDRAGNIFITMRGGTDANYEYFRFVAGTVPAGVTVETFVNTSSTSYITADPAMVCTGIIRGVTKPVTMALTMGAVNSSYDYKDVTINLTEVEV